MRQRATAAAVFHHRPRILAGGRSRGPLCISTHFCPRPARANTTEVNSMDYQKEYANLVGQIDRAITILEQFDPDADLIRRAGDLLLSALREAEEHYIDQQ